jgi:hypothetical protein
MHTIDSKEHQVVMLARADGHLVGTKPDYIANFAAQTNAVNREVAEIFNAHATNVMRIRGIWLIPTQTAITGAQQAFDVNKISAVGTGGTSVTPRPQDSGNPGTLTSMSAAYGSTGGATLSHLWFPIFLFNEETAAPVGLVAYQNQLPVYGDSVSEIVLRQNEGIQIKQTVGTVGLTGAMIQFALDG